MSKVNNKPVKADKKAEAPKKEAKKPVKPIVQDIDEESDEQTVPVNNKKVQKATKQNDVKPAKTEAKPAKAETKVAKKEAKAADAKPAKAEAKAPKAEVKATKAEAKPAKAESKVAKKEVKAEPKKEAKAEPKKKGEKLGKRAAVVDDEDLEDGDEDDMSGDELYGDDDIHLPKKKLKTAQGKEKVVKAEKKDKTDKKDKKDKSTKNKKATSDADTAPATDVSKESIEQSAEKLKKSKAARFAKKNKDIDSSHRGILYVGHLPYGFVEEALKEYFKQYGDILNIHLARSKKTARAMGYAFIEFKYKEVAKIAAESMNGYMLYGKKLVCRVIEDDEGVKVKTHKFKYIPYKLLFVEDKNREKTPQEIKKEVKHLLKSEEKKRTKLAELGIDYEFPGFKAALEESK